ncbi:MAG: M48 family metallopeptidase [Rickettsiales bacterium]|nr:M48 family metallopeptidase [Rickettsiales bacterium]
MIFEVSEESFKIFVDDKHIIINIRTSSRARNISLKINITGQAELVLPSKVSFNRARPFLIEKLPWLVTHLAAIETNSNQGQSEIPIFGVMHKIKYVISKKRYVQQFDEIIEVGSYPEFKEITLIRYLKKILLEEITKLVKVNSFVHNLSYKSIRLSRGVSTWGSCSRDGKLSFNWRLVFASRNVLEYLVAHEMAHLKERNHGPGFWRLANIIYPESYMARQWLKKEGRFLYGILQNHR